VEWRTRPCPSPPEPGYRSWRIDTGRRVPGCPRPPRSSLDAIGLRAVGERPRGFGVGRSPEPCASSLAGACATGERGLHHSQGPPTDSRRD
jgi:hypothetical protein